MSDELAFKIAKEVKIKRLKAHPMMDSIAVKLNSGPTYDEIQEAKYWTNIVLKHHLNLPDTELIAELHNTLPLVLYFGNDADRDEFIEILKEAKPNLAARKL